MKTTYPTWQEAHDAAQKTANESGLSLGIEKPTRFEPEWRVRYIPSKPENRFGWERQCEAVEPENKYSRGAR